MVSTINHHLCFCHHFQHHCLTFVTFTTYEDFGIWKFSTCRRISDFSTWRMLKNLIFSQLWRHLKICVYVYMYIYVWIVVICFFFATSRSRAGGIVYSCSRVLTLRCQCRMKYSSVLWIRPDSFIRSLFTKKNYIFDTFYILNVSSHSILLLKWFANLCFVSMPLYHLQRLAIPKSNWWTFAEIASQKSVPRPFLFFHLAKICQQNCCNRYDLFPSLAKMIALPRRDNLQVLQVCQMVSITSFEPLSPVVALKFWRSQKKTFSISSSSFYILLHLNLLYLFTF